MKRPPALLAFVLALLTLCLIASPIQGALAAVHPTHADTLLFKHFAGELMLFDFEIKDYSCSTRQGARESAVNIFTWQPTDKITYEVEYREGSPVRYTLRVYTGKTTEMDQDTLFALASFAMTFIDCRQEKASEAIENLMKTAKTENGLVLSELAMEDMTVHWAYDGEFAHLSVIPV